MEFEALWIGVNDRTVDNFDLEVVGDSTGKKHAFLALCREYRNETQFLGRHGQFDIHLCLSKCILGQCRSNKTSKPS